jgi:hypothetical protein
MKPIPLLGIGINSNSPEATAQTRVNFYLEKGDDKNSLYAYGTPGLSLFVSFGDTPIRGMYTNGDFIYCVHRDGFYSITNGGTIALLGTLLTSDGTVELSDNGLQIIVVDGTYGYTFTIATQVFARITSDGFPGARTVAFNDSFFIINKPDTGQFYISNSYDGNTWDALNFATAESNPDKLSKVYVDHGQVLLFGTDTLEFWYNSGALDFPYARISGASSEWGLASVRSIAKLDNSLIFLAKNKLGEVMVVTVTGYSITKVSTFDIETKFNNYSGVSDATGFSYNYNGHQFYQLNFTAGGESWLYDASMGIWSQLKSGDGRHYSEKCVSFFNKTITSDYANGNLYEIRGDVFTDNGTTIVSELTSKHSFAQQDRLQIHMLEIDMESGVGLATGQGDNPQIMLQISRDDGHTWGAEKWANMGRVGVYKSRAIWRRLGQSRDFVFRIRISDPVRRAIMGAYAYGT